MREQRSRKKTQSEDGNCFKNGKRRAVPDDAALTCEKNNKQGDHTGKDPRTGPSDREWTNYNNGRSREKSNDGDH